MIDDFLHFFDEKTIKKVSIVNIIGYLQTHAEIAIEGQAYNPVR